MNIVSAILARHIAPSAKKSLSLQKDGVFRLLVVMTALLGWIVAMGFGGLTMLESAYSQWHLTRSSEISIYLMADSPEPQIKKLTDTLLTTPNVKNVTRLSDEDIRALISPYFDTTAEGESEETAFPLPTVLSVIVDKHINRDTLLTKVKDITPEAEVDDARALLATIAKAVRVVQVLAIVLAVCLFVVMTFLVTLTVRTGLRAQRNTLEVLRYIGSTDDFLARLVITQVVRRALVGWAVAVTAATLTAAALYFFWPALHPFMHPMLLPATLFITPLVLPFLAYAAAKAACKKTLS